MPAEEISHAVLVGGSSRMPVVRDYLERLLAVPVTCEEDCDVAVALGLGTYVGIKQRAGRRQLGANGHLPAFAFDRRAQPSSAV